MSSGAYQELLAFWFDESHRANWFSKSDVFDGLIREKFLKQYEKARLGEFFHWRSSARGRLAEIILLDQFSRNMFRGNARSFESDSLALVLSQEAVRAGVDESLSPVERSFLYMPHMHSESLVVHEEAMRLFSQPGLEENLKFEIAHKKIIERFGRYPHRNALLGRVSSSEELEFLMGPGSSF